MIVNVNQCASAFDETLHALKFSALAKKVKSKNLWLLSDQFINCMP